MAILPTGLDGGPRGVQPPGLTSPCSSWRPLRARQRRPTHPSDRVVGPLVERRPNPVDRLIGIRLAYCTSQEILGAMSDSRVESLLYRFLSLDDRRDFSQAAAWEGDVGGFSCRLDGGDLKARPQDHYPNPQRAREVLEPHLRAWELWSELENAMRIQFKYAAAVVVDAASGAVHVESVEPVAVGTTVSSGTVNTGGDSYPRPSPKALAPSPLVEELLGWVRELREGRQRMLVLAYLFFTRLTYEYGNEVRAAAELNMSKEVLVTLRMLAAKNDPQHRRKVKGEVQPLTNAERFWITVALPRITRHVAEVAAGSNPPRLNMGPPELPSL